MAALPNHGSLPRRDGAEPAQRAAPDRTAHTHMANRDSLIPGSVPANSLSTPPKTSKKSLAIPPVRPATRAREPSPALSTGHVSASAMQSVEHGAHYAAEDADAAFPPTRTPTTPHANPWRNRGDHFWREYKGVVLMILSQMFGAMMSSTTRYLETLRDGVEPMSTFQVLFVRMSVTMVASLAYMWWAKVPQAPFGARKVRWLLLARGFGGFFGVFGLYYSLIYLPLAEATVITFLAPLLAAWICSILIKTPFTRVHKIAGFISVGGVVLIAQPFHFGQSTSSSDGATASTPSPSSLLLRASTISADAAPSVTPAQRALAVGCSLLGVCGAACAYTTISWIGKQAHPLISVNYFATWCTIVSTVVLIAVPGQSIRLPVDWREWLLIAFLGCSGFVMQFLLTASLSHDRNRSKALNMVYTQMLFALAMDKIVWGTTPGSMSIIGSSMILGSAVWIAVLREKGATETRRSEGGANDEERGLVAGMDGTEEDEGEEEARVPARFTVGEAEHEDINHDDEDDTDGMDDEIEMNDMNDSGELQAK